MEERPVSTLGWTAGSRSAQACGITANPNTDWMLQIERNLTRCEVGCVTGKSHLIMDRDTKVPDRFKTILNDPAVEMVVWTPGSPRFNASVERFVESIKFECLNEPIFLGRRHQGGSIGKYTSYDNGHRNHQGVGSELMPRENLLRKGRLNWPHTVFCESFSEMFDTEGMVMRVVLNGEEQYSLWPQSKELPAGWREEGFVGTKEECLDHVEKVWTDMRPLSLRKKIDRTMKPSIGKEG